GRCRVRVAGYGPARAGLGPARGPADREGLAVQRVAVEAARGGGRGVRRRDRGPRVARAPRGAHGPGSGFRPRDLRRGPVRDRPTGRGAPLAGKPAPARAPRPGETYSLVNRQDRRPSASW